MDSSFAVKLVVIEENSEQAAELWRSWLTSDIVIAPTLLAYEVTSVLRTATYRGRISEESALAGLDAFFDLPIKFQASRLVHEQALHLSARLGVGAAYDAHYLALAEQFGCSLWTADRGMYSAATGLFLDAHRLGT